MSRRWGRDVRALGARSRWSMVLVLVVAGCTPTLLVESGSASSASPAADQDPTPTPMSEATASPVAPTLMPPGDDWGPLAVLPPDDGMDTARAEGSLRITDRCTYLERGDDRLLLLWPVEQTAWDATGRDIAFTGLDGTTVRVGDGARLVVGGGGGRLSELPEDLPWVSRPDSSCGADLLWAVGTVDVQEAD